MEEFARLHVETEFNAFTNSSHIVSAEWVGHHSLKLRVDRNELDDEILKLLPFSLEETKDLYDPLSPFRYYIRKDRNYWLAYHRFMSDWARILSAWQWVRSRIIMTLIIWGIGWVEPYQIIDWYCLGQKRPYAS